MAPGSLRQAKAAATLELTVETLTGTGFRLRVSSFETVMSVKARIQRIEGVPVSQQHLLYRDRELCDSATLRDSGVVTSSVLKLVVAMRGGPVNTRRLPMYEDFTHAEMQQLMQLQSEAAWEEEAGRQVTLLVFREGDQVNFYRVMENTDGTFSPLSDSWGSSLRNMFDEEPPEEVRRRLEENAATMDKMAELRQRMQQAAAQRKKARVRPARQSAAAAAAGDDPVRVRLPPVLTAATPATRPPTSSGPGHDLSESFSRLAAGTGTSAARRRRHAAPPSAASDQATAEERSPASRGAGSHYSSAAAGGTSARRRKLSLSESTELFKQLQSQRSRERHASAAAPAVPPRTDYGAYRRTLARLTRQQTTTTTEPPLSPLSPAPVATAGGTEGSTAAPAAAELPVLFETDERRAPAVAVRRAPRSAGSLSRASPCPTYSKDDSERPRSPALSLLPTDGRARQLCRILSARAALSSTASPAPPPATRRTKRDRCQHCRRRLGLASVYRCHCGGQFCTQHRYPELHMCGYDFKTEGRKLLRTSNPLVTAPKLPKI